MRVLIVGHACGPGLGSEPGNTWELARRMAESHDVWLISHPEHRDLVEGEMRSRPIPNLRIAWVTVDNPLDGWRPEEGESGIRFHYVLWLKQAYREARRLHAEIGFDVLHHASWGTVGVAPPVWRLDVPVIWGPMGGAQTTPSAFLSYFENHSLRERMRNVYARLRRFSPSLRRCVRHVSVHLAVNQDTEALLRQSGAADVRRFLDCGLKERNYTQNPRTLSSSEECKLLWAGRLEHRKGLRLAIEAMARLRHLPAKLYVAGGGNDRPSYESRARELGVEEKIVFLGRVSRDEMPGLFRTADAFVFTSLRDSFGSVALEAMSHALPIIMLDHQGVKAFVPDAAALKVPVNTPEQVIEDLAAAIEKMASCAACRLRMGSAALEMANQETWEQRVVRLSALYQEVISAHRRL